MPSPTERSGRCRPSPRGDVDDVGVRGRDGDRADRARGLVVEDRAPDAAVVGRLPHAAVADADVEDVGLRRDAGDGAGAAGPVGADRAPAHLAEELLIEGLGLERGRGEKRCQEDQDRGAGEEPGGRSCRRRCFRRGHVPKVRVPGSVAVESHSIPPPARRPDRLHPAQMGSNLPFAAKGRFDPIRST